MSKRKQLVEASISLFSSSGIGDLGIEYGCGIEVSISAELLPQRVKLLRHNYPKSTVIEGDITKTAPKVIKVWNKKHCNARPLLITLSPPCQGMSTNGAGKIAAEVKKGKRPKEDERNKLLIPGLGVVRSLQPEYFLIENVSNMKNTVVSGNRNKPKRLIELIPKSVGKGYEIHSFVIDFANYGVPHHRKAPDHNWKAYGCTRKVLFLNIRSRRTGLIQEVSRSKFLFQKQSAISCEPKKVIDCTALQK